MGRCPSARAQYARELTIAEGAGSRAARMVIDPLLGIARSYRLEAMIGNDEEAAQYADPFVQPSVGVLGDHGGHGLHPDGEKALLLALQTIDKMRPLDHQLRGTTPLELGDCDPSADLPHQSLPLYPPAR